MGRQRAGKDTTADYLVNYYGFEKVSLAKPVYGIGRDVFGMSGKDRGLLIQIAVKMREIDPLVFPKTLWRTVAGAMEKPLPAGSRIVVADARFPNEFSFFRERGGIAVRITASQDVRSQRPGFTGEHETDPTETSLDTATADAQLLNEGTYGELYDSIDSLAKNYLKLTRRG
jgi:hypothetical protein